MQAELRRFADFNGLSEEEIEARCAGLHAKVVALTLIRNAAERSYGEIMEALSSHCICVHAMRFLASCSTLDCVKITPNCVNAPLYIIIIVNLIV